MSVLITNHVALIRDIVSLLSIDAVRSLIKGIVDLWHRNRFHGTYHVDELQISLELKDREGNTAVYTKRQQVTFLQDGVFAIQDQAWGDGDIFADYQCSPGVAVDHYEEGFRKKILISLRQTRNKDDHEEFLIQRTIKNGFSQPNSYLQVRIDHPTKALSLSIIFPRTRKPRSVSVVEEHTKKTHSLYAPHIKQLLDERTEYRWIIAKPRLYEGYILQWEW